MIRFAPCSHQICIGFLVIILISFMNACYIAKYKKLQKDYETIRKDYIKENSKLQRTKQQFRQKADSLNMVNNSIHNLIHQFKNNQTFTDSLCRIIIADKRFQWTTQEKENCMTVTNIKVLSKEEKEVYLYLNLARKFPSKFAELYVQPYMGTFYATYINDSTYELGDTNSIWFQSYYSNSLYIQMKNMEPMQVLHFDKKCWESAECHSTTIGKKGYVTHERENGCISYFSGECCHYGSSDGLDIIVDLLVDTNVESLGHRRICLSSSYRVVGISMKPHISYRKNTTLDFTY